MLSCCSENQEFSREDILLVLLVFWYAIKHGKGYKAFSLYITFRLINYCLFLLESVIWFESAHSCLPTAFINVSITAPGCCECREPELKHESCTEAFSPGRAMPASLGHGWVGEWYWFQSIIFGFPLDHHQTPPFLAHHIDCWMCDSSLELLRTDNLPFPL